MLVTPTQGPLISVQYAFHCHDLGWFLSEPVQLSYKKSAKKGPRGEGVGNCVVLLLPVQGLSGNLESDAIVLCTLSFSVLQTLRNPAPCSWPCYGVYGCCQARKFLWPLLHSCMPLLVTRRVGGVTHLWKHGKVRVWLGQKPVIE